MPTNAQRLILKALAEADGTANGYMTAGNDQALADWFNTLASPAFIVWRHNIDVDECMNVLVWTEVDSLTVGRARIWEWMQKLDTLDARQPNVRSGIAEAFAGAGAANTRAALTVLAKRSATRAEKALSTGTGSDASPALMDAPGNISPSEASLIRVAV